MFISEIFSQHPGIEAFEDDPDLVIQEGNADADAVRAIQKALIILGYDQPGFGVDGDIRGETSEAISKYRVDRQLPPGVAQVTQSVAALMDREVAFLEGSADIGPGLERAAFRDPLMAQVFDRQLGTSFAQGVMDSLEFGNKLCFRITALLEDLTLAQAMGHAVEPFLFADYKKQFLSGDLFLDTVKSPQKAYHDFLKRNHPNAPSFILKVSRGVRPDIASHREDPPTFYELKPDSPSGLAKGIAKVRVLTFGYRLAFSNPYVPGTGFTPTSPIVLGPLFGPQGENMRLTLNFRRCAPGLILYWFCVDGDYVLYFNRARLAAGILAIFVALLQAALAAGVIAGITAEVAAVISAAVAAIQAIAAELALVLPIVTMALNPA
jgi:peptidoglycan hydrolase-like protein with peptidoglycan-binding domain